MKDQIWLWKERYAKARAEYEDELKGFDSNLSLYRGTHEIDAPVNNTRNAPIKKASMVRNFTYELIESQVDSTIPAPKVTARHPTKRNLENARIIEDMIRNELDSLPMEYLNDEDERNTYLMGGSAYLVEWDNSKRTHTTVGELSVRLLHPKQLLPQPGVFYLHFMGYLFITFDDTKDRIEARYGVSVEDETTDPDVSSALNSDEIVTQVVAYYVNEQGGIGVFSWAGNTVLEDLPDYQSRHGKVCAKCGLSKPHGESRCSCGCNKWKTKPNKYEELAEDIVLSDGTVIPAVSPAMDEAGNPVMDTFETPLIQNGYPVFQYAIDPSTGLPVQDEAGMPVEQPVMASYQQQRMEPTKIPYYVPNRFPVVVRKNISAYGKVLGDSDCSAIRDLQMGYNKLATCIEEKLIKGGSVLTLPRDLRIETDDREMKVVRLDNPQQKAMIDALDLSPNIVQDMQVMLNYYEHARSTLGITDSYQGKPDSTATSGVAKQFAAQQAAGRIESKRKMKNAAYAELFEVIFKFMLAYADEPRVYVSTDANGKKVERVFNRYEFLQQDAMGNWYWDDEYLFSTDISGTLAKDRQGMWQETRLNLQQGAFGNIADLNTLLLFWREMENLHYPNAGRIITQLEQQQKMARIEQQMMQQKSRAAQIMQGMAQGLPPEQIGVMASGAVMPQQAQPARQTQNPQGGEQNAVPGM